MPVRPLRVLLTLACSLALIPMVLLNPATAAPVVMADKASSPVRGQDISWPNCPKGMGIPSRRTEGRPMPRSSAKFVVVGLTNGPGFHPNPCLAKHAVWVKSHHVYAAPYAMTTYPTKKEVKRYGKNGGPFAGNTTNGRLRNTGYAQATYNIANMRKVGLTSPVIWVDVEPYPVAPWSKSRSRNKAVFDGVLRGYRDAGLTVGVYASEAPYRAIIGSAHYKLPEWQTVGTDGKAAALRACKFRSTQGGEIVMAQWWKNRTADFDLLCPGYASADNLKRYFRKY